MVLKKVDIYMLLLSSITAVLVAFPNPTSVRWGCTSAPPILRAVVCVAEWLATFLPMPKIVDHFPIVVLIVFI